MSRSITWNEAVEKAQRYMRTSKLTRPQFAEAIGVHVHNLNAMLGGRRSPAKIAAYFGYTVPGFVKEEK